MDSLIQAIEVFALVTGIVYVVLEILQKNSMWVLGILTGAACAFEFAITHVWASMGLNIYYVAMSVVGLVQWKKASEAVGSGEIHLAPLSGRVLAFSSLLLIAGVVGLTPLLKAAGGAVPLLDATAFTLSVIATWWLAQSYLEQWLLWIVADILSTTLCILTGQNWMAFLYGVYTLSAVYGFFHWKRHGKFVHLPV